MNCLYPVTIYIHTDKKHSRYRSQNKTDCRVKVRCGHCINCIEEKNRIWTYRLMAEMKTHTKICFITLTYDDDHLPVNGSCCKKDIQDLMKRIRRYYGYHSKHRKNLQKVRRRKSETQKEIENLTYFGCTEYGGAFGRPHIHLLILGMDYEDWFPQHKKIQSHNTVMADSPFWRFGHINYGSDVSLADSRLVRYVTKYIDKLDSDNLYKYCRIMEIEKPTILHSVGIGADYLLHNCNDSGDLPRLNGLQVSLPPYWQKKFDIAMNQEDRKKGILHDLKKQKQRSQIMQGMVDSDENYAKQIERCKRGIK